MTPRIFLSVLLVLTASLSNAQTNLPANQNPFRNVQFTNTPSDTVTIAADFANIVGELTANQLDIFSVISKYDKIDLKKFKYAIGFKIPGYEQLFYAPCKDIRMYKTLGEKKHETAKLKLHCVVFRFNYADLTTNFFYVDKVSL